VAPGSLVVVDSQATEIQGLKFADLDAKVIEPKRFLVPPDLPAGDTALSLSTATIALKGTASIQSAAPGLFSAAGDGKGAALATAVTLAEDGTEATAPAYACENSVCSPAPIDLGAESSKTVLRLIATGLRLADLSTVAALIGDEPAQVEGIDPSEEEGKEVVRIVLDRKLAGRGELDVVVVAGERRSNAVRITVK
jgi:uncharacterized protein (TIGR03437 family)